MAQQTDKEIHDKAVHDKAVHDKDLAPHPGPSGPLAKAIATKTKDPNPTAELIVVWDGYLVVLCKDGSIWSSVQKGPLFEPPLAWHRLQSPEDLMPPTVDQAPVGAGGPHS